MTLLSLLPACTTQRSALRSAASYQAKTPAENFAFDIVAGLAKVRATIVLRAGQYDPIGQDDFGVWYAGKPDTLLIIYLDSPKNRIDSKLATAVYQGGIFVPHDRSQAAKMFYVPASEKFWITDPATVGSTGIVNFASKDFLNDVVLQQVTTSSFPVQAAVGGAIAGAIVAFDAGGFKMHPVSPPEDKSLRAWLGI